MRSAARRTTAGGWALLAVAAFIGTWVATSDVVPAVVSFLLAAGLGLCLVVPRRRVTGRERRD